MIQMQSAYRTHFDSKLDTWPEYRTAEYSWPKDQINRKLKDHKWPYDGIVNECDIYSVNHDV